MNRQQRDANRANAQALAEEVFEANLPDGLYMRSGVMTYDCEGCGGECEWHGTPEEFDEPNEIKVGGCTEWCLP